MGVNSLRSILLKASYRRESRKNKVRYINNVRRKNRFVFSKKMTLKFWKNKICYDSCGASREKFKNGKNKGF